MTPFLAPREQEHVFFFFCFTLHSLSFKDNASFDGAFMCHRSLHNVKNAFMFLIGK